MGNDGGSIPKRSELVKESAAKPSTSAIFEQQQINGSFPWNTCPISLEPLTEPIVSDYKGQLFNKEAILEWLVDPSKFSSQMSAKHIKSLKDVVDLKFTAISQDGETVWICPVSRKEVKANAGRFAYLVPCGHVFSEGALREIDQKICLECNEPFEPRDIIIINPSDMKDIQQAEERMTQLADAGLTHNLKSSLKKKRKHKEGKESKKPKKERSSPVNVESDNRSDAMDKARLLVKESEKKRLDLDNQSSVRRSLFAKS